MRITSFVLVLSSFFSIIKAQESNNYFITMEGEKIICPENSVRIHPVDRSIMVYSESSNKWKYYSRANVRVLYADSITDDNTAGRGVVYFSMPTSKRFNSLLKIVAFNDKYILTETTLANIRYLYIFDWSSNIILDKTPAHQPQKMRENVLNIVKTYFKGCDQLIEMVEKNCRSSYRWQNPLDRISAVQCGEKNFLETLPK